MRYVELPGTDLRASALGFGCASIGGRVDRRTALRALEQAYDLGINYFDVARSYGYGEAEAVLGEFLQGRRSEVLVATKVGLAPPAHHGFLRATLPLTREIMSWIPRHGRDLLRNVAVQSGVTDASRGRFNVEEVRESLETSLRKLKTDYVDVLLLHSCRLGDALDPELQAFLEQCVQRGKIKYYGIATNVSTCNRILKAHSAYQVTQFAHNLSDPGMEFFSNELNTATVTHSPLGRDSNLIQRLTSYARRHPETGQEWSAYVGMDMRKATGVAKVLLSHAFWENQDGVVLCGMFDEIHLGANVGTAIRPIAEEPLKKVLDSMRDVLMTEETA